MGKTLAPPLNGKRIAQARAELNLTQPQVMAMCLERGQEIDQATLSRIENGRVRWPSKRLLPVLAEVLGIPDDEMFAEETEPEPAAA
jgi:transcriptional regulator with XRE-family HTH domain